MRPPLKPRKNRRKCVKATKEWPGPMFLPNHIHYSLLLFCKIFFMLSVIKCSVTSSSTTITPFSFKNNTTDHLQVVNIEKFVKTKPDKLMMMVEEISNEDEDDEDEDEDDVFDEEYEEIDYYNLDEPPSLPLINYQQENFSKYNITSETSTTNHYYNNQIDASISSNLAFDDDIAHNHQVQKFNNKLHQDDNDDEEDDQQQQQQQKYGSFAHQLKTENQKIRKRRKDGTDDHSSSSMVVRLRRGGGLDNQQKLKPDSSSSMLTILLPSRVKKPLIEAHQHQIYSDVNAVYGQMTRLPCFVRPLGPSDSISLVLWYRGEDISGTPIYSVDARHQPFEHAQHFIHKSYQHKQLMNFTLNTNNDNDHTQAQSTGDDGQWFSDNHQTITSTMATITTTPSFTSSSTLSSNSTTITKPISKSTAHLYVKPVEEQDAGLYWCRVDYKWERTTISTVTLNVIVPPRQLQILLKMDPRPRLSSTFPSSSSDGQLSSPIAPSIAPASMNSILKTLEPNETLVLNEDESATLICLSEGGKPLPILNWYRNEELIRQQIFHILTAKNHTLQSELHLTPIRAIDHNCLLKCLSSNDNHTFLSSQIHLRINTKPTKVDLKIMNPKQLNLTINNHQRHHHQNQTITAKNLAIISGDEITVRCRSYGSRPIANHTWYLMPGYRLLSIFKHNAILDHSTKRKQHSPTTSDLMMEQTDDDDDDDDDGKYMDVDNDDDDSTLITETFVRLTVQTEDNGHRLICRAQNPMLQDPRSALENHLDLDIVFAPKVNLQQIINDGQSSDQQSRIIDPKTPASLPIGYVIRGRTLQLQCNISSNPMVLPKDIFWYKDSVLISSPEQSTATSSSTMATTESTTISTNNITKTNANNTVSMIKFTHNGTRLLINKVSDEWQGFYQCVARNHYGTGFSNQFQIQILYEPNCITPTQTIPANIGSVVTMICEVDANPSNVTFYWRSKHQELSTSKSVLFDRQHQGKYFISEPELPVVNHFYHQTGPGPGNNGFIGKISHQKGIIRNRMEVRIESNDDYGQYQCWAKNMAGDQMEPCLYNIYENPIKHQLICDTNISYELIQVNCQPDANAANNNGEGNHGDQGLSSKDENHGDYKNKNLPNHIINNNSSNNLHLDPTRRKWTKNSMKSESKSSSKHQHSILYNLKIFKDKRQLINITSIEPKFLVHVNELIILDSNDGDGVAANGKGQDSIDGGSMNSDPLDNNQHYLMHISALMVNGVRRPISDISLSFKVPNRPIIQPSTSSKINSDNNILDDGHVGDHVLSDHFNQNLSTISRYKKISEGDLQFEAVLEEPDNKEPNKIDHAEKPTLRRTSTSNREVASFHRTVSLNNVIRQLPLFWMILLSTVVIILLVILLSTVWIKVRIVRNRNQPHHQPKSPQNQMKNEKFKIQGPIVKTVRFDSNNNGKDTTWAVGEEMEIIDGNLEEDQLDGKEDNNKSCPNDNMLINNKNQQQKSLLNHHHHYYNECSNNGLNNLNNNNSRSIRLFTLANFDHHEQQQSIPGIIAETGQQQSGQLYNNHSHLPDLMMDTLTTTTTTNSTNSALCDNIPLDSSGVMPPNEHHHFEDLVDHLVSGQHGLLEDSTTNNNSESNFIYVTLTEPPSSTAPTAHHPDLLGLHCSTESSSSSTTATLNPYSTSTFHQRVSLIQPMLGTTDSTSFSSTTSSSANTAATALSTNGTIQMQDLSSTSTIALVKNNPHFASTTTFWPK